MPEGRLVKHRWMAQSDRNMQMRRRRQDAEIVENCMGATFHITGKGGAECFEGVDYFKYLGRVLHRSDEDWLAVLWNIWRERQV